jgi:hypothetical protein
MMLVNERERQKLSQVMNGSALVEQRGLRALKGASSSSLRPHTLVA